MSEHSAIVDTIEQVIVDMQSRRELKIDCCKVGDKAAGILDPNRRSPALTFYCSRMYCHGIARDVLAQIRERAERKAADDAQSRFELLCEYYPLAGSNGVSIRREAMTLPEREAYSELLAKEIATKGRHREAFDAETAMLVRDHMFDENG